MRHGPAFWSAALGVAALAGFAGCFSEGVAGLAGLSLGLSLGAAPMLMRAEAG